MSCNVLSPLRLVFIMQSHEPTPSSGHCHVLARVYILVVNKKMMCSVDFELRALAATDYRRVNTHLGVVGDGVAVPDDDRLTI